MADALQRAMLERLMRPRLGQGPNARPSFAPQPGPSLFAQYIQPLMDLTTDTGFLDTPENLWTAAASPSLRPTDDIEPPQFVKTLSMFAPGTGEAQDATDLGMSLADFRNDPSWGNAGMVGASGLSLMLPGVAGLAGIIAGKGAKTADLVKLRRAQDMAEKGIPRQAIWDETGWFKGVDGEWRFEIDDSLAKVDQNNPALQSRLDVAADYYAKHGGERRAAFASGQNRALDAEALRYADEVGERGRPIGEAVSHNLLFSAYPDIPRKRLLPGNDAGLHGSYNPRTGNIAIGRGSIMNPTDPRSTFLHEGQHAVQHQENFAKGGRTGLLHSTVTGPTPSRDDLILAGNIRYLVDNWPGGAGEYFKAYPESLPEGTVYTSEALRLANEPEELDRAWKIYNRNTSGEETYRHLAGEVEARMVQSRKDMMPAERVARPPWLDYDIPEDMQIVHRGYGEMASYSTPKHGIRAGEQNNRSLVEIEDAARRAGVELSLSQRGNQITVNKIVVPKTSQNQGVGSQIMQSLADFADANQKTLALTPSGDFGGSKKRLKAFYERFGFEPNRGRSVDHAIGETMRRYPAK